MWMSVTVIVHWVIPKLNECLTLICKLIINLVFTIFTQSYCLKNWFEGICVCALTHNAPQLMPLMNEEHCAFRHNYNVRALWFFYFKCRQFMLKHNAWKQMPSKTVVNFSVDYCCCCCWNACLTTGIVFLQPPSSPLLLCLSVCLSLSLSLSLCLSVSVCLSLSLSLCLSLSLLVVVLLLFVVVSCRLFLWHVPLGEYFFLVL